LDDPDPTAKWLTGVGVPAELKAFSNALPITVEQLQDGHRLARGHPFAHLVPTCLAAAELSSAKGSTILEGLLLGYEVGARLGMVMLGTPRGIHDIGTWGTLGAVVGSTHILTAGDEALSAASLRLASSAVIALDTENVFSGFGVSHLYLATACQLAMQFAKAAAIGTSTAPNTLERYWLPRLSTDQTLFSVDWSQVQTTNGYFKLYPTVAHAHGANGAIDQFLQQARLLPFEDQLERRIKSIEVSTYSPAAQFCNQNPQSVDACRFSIPFTIATAIVNRHLGLNTNFTLALNDSRVQDLAKRVVVKEDASLTARYPHDGRPTRILVEFADGTTVETTCDLPPGDGPEALENPDVLSKPTALVAGIIPQSSWHSLRYTVENLGQTTAAELFQAIADLKRSC
jgi:2-methylcitrate dehydratase PrpD